MGMIARMREDIAAVFGRDPAARSTLETRPFKPGQSTANRVSSPEMGVTLRPLSTKAYNSSNVGMVTITCTALLRNAYSATHGFTSASGTRRCSSNRKR